MEIIKAELEDLPTIRNLALKIWPATYGEILSGDQLEYMLEWIYSHDSLTEQVLNKKHEFYLAVDEATEAGFISLEKNPRDPSIFILHKIYVLPEKQGKGIGKTLLNFALEKTKDGGGQFLRLNVNRHNKARQFYEKFGFKIILEEDIDIGNGYLMNDYKMEYNISG